LEHVVPDLLSLELATSRTPPLEVVAIVCIQRDKNGFRTCTIVGIFFYKSNDLRPEKRGVCCLIETQMSRTPNVRRELMIIVCCLFLRLFIHACEYCFLKRKTNVVNSISIRIYYFQAHIVCGDIFDNFIFFLFHYNIDLFGRINTISWVRVQCVFPFMVKHVFCFVRS
jgi:hypothetical protein